MSGALGRGCTYLFWSIYLSGTYCETKIPFCAKEYNPCENGARCVDHFTHYTCECVPGFSGVNCTTNIDDCANHLCQVISLNFLDIYKKIF